ncbi:hypothetical protein CRYUN_Cryun05aG0146700 [Craigia yunnanensis]
MNLRAHPHHNSHSPGGSGCREDCWSEGATEVTSVERTGKKSLTPLTPSETALSQGKPTSSARTGSTR